MGDDGWDEPTDGGSDERKCSSERSGGISANSSLSFASGVSPDDSDRSELSLALGKEGPSVWGPAPPACVWSWITAGCLLYIASSTQWLWFAGNP